MKYIAKFCLILLDQIFESLIAVTIVLMYLLCVTIMYEFAGAVAGIVFAGFFLIYGDGVVTNFNSIARSVHKAAVGIGHWPKLFIIILLLPALFVDWDRDGLSSFIEMVPMTLGRNSAAPLKLDIKSVTIPIFFDSNRDLLYDGFSKRNLGLVVQGISPFSSGNSGDLPAICVLLEADNPTLCISRLNAFTADCSVERNAYKVVGKIDGEILVCEDFVGYRNRERIEQLKARAEDIIHVLELI